MSYAQRRAAALIGLTIYISIGFSAYMLSHDGEDAYPFFSWFLFVNVPPRVQSGFDVQIGDTSLGDSAQFRTDGLIRRDVIALENRIGQAVKSGNAQEIREARHSIESRLPSGMAYRVRELTYDPLEYFTSKSILRETTIGEFTAP